MLVLATFTYVVLSIGGPLAVSIFLVILSAAGEDHLSTVWRICFGIGIVLPVTVLYFRMRMPSSKLYERGAIKRESLIGYVMLRFRRLYILRRGPLLAHRQEILESTDWYMWIVAHL